MMNQGVHTVDLLVAAMGRPVEVFAYTGTLAHERIEIEDVAVAVVQFESGALGVLHATTAAYPGLSARLQVHGDKGSVVIDNDELTFIHRAAYAGDQRDVSYGANSASDNQKDSLDLPDRRRSRAGRDPGSCPTPTGRSTSTSSAALAGARAAAGRPGDQPPGDRGHHRRLRVGADRTAGEAHVSAPRIAANPIPYWAKAGKSREVFEQAFRDFPDIGYTAVKADVPEGMTRGGVPRLDRRLRPGAVAQPVQLAVRRDGRRGRRDRAGQAVRRRPRRRSAWTGR